MKTKIYRHTVKLLMLLLLSSSTLLNAQQLKLGKNPTITQKSALLELESNSQGLLLPRITDTTQATIKTAPDGMIIFLTLNNSLCIRAGGQWYKLIPEGEALSSLNGSTVPVQTITATSNAAPASMTTIGGNHFLNLPDATVSYSGFVGTGVQTFAGAKTFNGNLTAYQDLLLPNIIVDNTKDSVLLIDAGKVWKKRLTGLPPTGAASGDLSGTYPSPVIAAGAITGAKMAQAGATAGQVLKWNGTTWAPAADDNTGSLSSVGLTATPAVFTVSNSPLTANGAIALGLQTQTANTVFAGPGTGGAAVPTFRALAAGDIPALPFSKITTGVVPIAQGGTGLNAIGANGTFLSSNGAGMAYRGLAAADIPNLSFSKITTGVVPIAQGGTGLSAPGTVGYLLVSTGTGLTYMDPVLGGDVINNAFANSIAPKAVTYAKMQDVNTQKILGRYTAGTGSVQEVSLDNSLKLTTGGTLYADSSLAVWNASKFLGRSLSPLAPTTGQVLKYNGTTWEPAADNNTGSLSSVGLIATPAVFTVTNSPLTANGDITLALQVQGANTVFAGPGTGTAIPAFRTLAAGDIPTLPFSKITGTVPVLQGGTGLTAVGAAGTVLTSNGSSLIYSAPAVGLTSVGLTMPSIFSITGSPLTANGTIATTLQNQNANTIFAGPGTGVATAPVFRSMVTADIPDQGVTYAKIQNVTTQKLLGRYTAGVGSVQEVSLDNSLKLTTAGTLYADSALAVWNAGALQGRRISAVAPTDNYILKWDAASSTWGPEVETSATNWTFTGNNNTTAASFLGTTVDQPMVLKYNNKELFRGTKGIGVYVNKTVSLFNGATAYNGHPVIIKANGADVLAFQDSTGVIKWHWNLLGDGLNFVESEVADYRLFLQNGGNVGVNTNTPTSTLHVNGSMSTDIISVPYGTTLNDTMYTVVVTSTGNGTINIPRAVPANAGRTYIIKKGVAGTNTLTVQTVTPAQQIDGATTVTTNVAYGVIMVQSDGTKWWWINR